LAGIELRALPSAGLIRGKSHKASSCVLAGPFCDFGPAIRDQKLGIAGGHFECAIRAHVVVPVWTGLHGADARWCPKPNPGLRGFPLPLEFLGLHAVELEYVLARKRLFEPVEKLRGRVDLIVVLAFREDPISCR
jgi:hypothetical protein